MICRLASYKLWRVREAVHVNGSSACCWTSRRDCTVISIRSFNLWTRHISSRSRRLLVPWLWNPGIATLDPQASWRVSTTYLRLIRHGTFQQFQNVRICSLVIGNFSWICHESSILIAIISIEEIGGKTGLVCVVHPQNCFPASGVLFPLAGRLWGRVHDFHALREARITPWTNSPYI